jgi:hypothetical protein
MHLSVSIPSFIAGYWEGYLSALLGTTFVGVSIACWFARFELSVLKDQKRLRLRHGTRHIALERSVPFEHICGVRLTLTPPPRQIDSRIELLCHNGDIECPPTPVPRQFALYLAMTMDVRLIRISPEKPATPTSHRLKSL